MTGDGRAVSILLVEDEELNRALVRAVLDRAADPRLKAARLIEAGDLAQARAHLREAPVDLVLLDVQLPDGSGLGLARELTADRVAPRPAIVALTAGVLPEQLDAAREAGCDAVLAKPYQYASLLKLLVEQLPD